MRICLVSREFVPFWGAGIGTYASQMAAAWTAAGHETHVVCPPHPKIAELGPRIRPGVQFHPVDLKDGVLAWEPAYRGDFQRHAMGVYHKLLALHAKHPFDYIEFPEYWGEGYFVLRGRQTLGQFEGAVLGARLHTPTRECKELNRDAWLDEQIAYLEHSEDESMRLADVLVSPSTSLLEKVRARLRLEGIPGHVVPYPFDVESSVSELGAEGTKVAAPDLPEILYFGRIEHRKGVHLLVEAAQHLLDEGVSLRVRLVGRDTPSGPSGRMMLPYVRRLVRPEWRDRIIFEAARPRAELGALIRASTVCCFPSLWENFPNACLEAMCLGAVVVGSDAGGMSEIIEHDQSGILFSSGDVHSLAGALRRALADEGLRRKLSRNAPHRIGELCDPATVVRTMEKVIEDVRAARDERAAHAAGTAAAEATDDSPLVSFIIPHYNLGAYLGETIESCHRQTCKNFEVIVVDDGSTDVESLAAVEAAESGRYGPVRLIRKDNGGLSSARNTGIAAARGRWVVPLDADDILAPTFTETMLAAAARHPGIAFVTSLVSNFTRSWGDLERGWIPLGLDRDILACRNCAACCTALFDRRMIVELGGYDEWLTSYEDWDLYCRLAAAGGRGLVVPAFLIGYRTRPDSMLRTEGRMRGDHIRAYLYAKHAGLSEDPNRTLRLHLAPEMAECRAQTLIAENIRYRVADRVNDMLKKARVQGRIKDLAAKFMRNGHGTP